MENTEIKTLKERIADQSKTIIIMAKVARVLLYVMLGFAIASIVVSFLPPEASVLRIFGKDFKLFDILGDESLAQMRETMVKEIIAIGISQAILYMLTALFTRIQQSESPFTSEIANKIKTIGILLGVAIALENIYLGIIVAFVVFAIALIFSYGAELQRQVDETL